MATKAATATIPIVFRTSTDPVQAGLVASLNRPGGNVTGTTSMDWELMPKQLGLLHELLPAATRFAALIDPTGFRISESLGKFIVSELQGATSSIGRHLEVLHASSSAEIDMAFAAMVEKRVDAVLVSSNVFFQSGRTQIVTNAVFHRLPVIYFTRDWVETGGLMSYGTRNTDIYRLAGLVPKAATVAGLIDPKQPIAETRQLPEARDATAALGQKLLVLEASTAHRRGQRSSSTRGRRLEADVRAGGEDDRNPAADEIGRHGRQAIVVIVHPAVLNRYVAALDVACFGKTPVKAGHALRLLYG
jgi:hypothetical protein